MKTNNYTDQCPRCGAYTEYDTWYEFWGNEVAFGWECSECDATGYDTYTMTKMEID